MSDQPTIQELREVAQRAVGAGDVTTLANTVEQLERCIGNDADVGIRADLLRYKGTLCSLQADYEGALTHFKHGLEIIDQQHNHPLVARITNNIGVVYHTMANYPEALFWYRKSLDAREADNDMMGVARVSGNIGILYSSLGDVQRAREFYERSLQISKSLNDEEGVARSTVALGNMYVRLQQLEDATSTLAAGMELCKAHGMDREWLTASSSLAAVLHQRGEYQQAIDLVISAAPIAQKVGLKREQLLLSIAQILSSYKLSNSVDDVHNLAQLVDQARELGLANEEKDIHKELYLMFKERADPSQALHYHEQWVAVKEKIESDDRQRQLILLEADQRMREERLRVEEHQRLLYNMLPASIAKRLLNGETGIADSFDSLSVLFTDIVGFTQKAAGMEVEDLISLLNGLFSKFDEIVHQHGVTKIKTIGDAYMAVAGAPDPLDAYESARRLASAAVELVNATQEISIRVGLHAGPAVAGVIGTERMVWDIWGDAVNVAARMEQTSIANRIQVSDEFAQLLSRGAQPVLQGTDILIYADGFVLKMRGTIEVKGKGEMKTFWLEQAS
ncbi:MAG: tetratricopeptide repeat protein [Bradyrhizobiaceae bacterium]|nr:tetratricopeptide repeat protein [Bradyrhizobiaceae bacterium]